MRKYWTYSEVKELVDSTGNTLLSTSYYHKEPLKILCSCGAVYYSTFKVFKRRLYKMCPKCMCAVRVGELKVAPLHKSFGYLYPELLEEWDYVKNADIDPYHIYPGINRAFWWVNEFGDCWSQSLQIRTLRGGTNRLYSNNTSYIQQKLYNEFNSMFDVVLNYRIRPYEFDLYFPAHKLVIEFDGYRWHKNKFYEDLAKNSFCHHYDLSLVRLRGCNSGKKALRKVTVNDYQMQAKGYSSLTIVEMQNICLHLYNVTKITKFLDLVRIYDTGVWLSREMLRTPLKIENSIYSTHPHLLSEWDWDKNGEAHPKMLSAGSPVKAYWVCKTCGYRWLASIKSRAGKQSTGCPKCSGNLPYTLNYFLEEAKRIHGSTYDYTLISTIVNSVTKVPIVCSVHGVFYQTPLQHLKGRGCRRCNASAGAKRRWRKNPMEVEDED